MAKDVFLVRDKAGFAPMDEAAADVISKIPAGAVIKASWVSPRNIRAHRLFFAMLKIVSDNMDNCSVDNLLDVIKLGTGHTKIIELPGGAYYAIPKSISFSAMDQDTFSAFFTKAVDYIISDVLPGIDKEALTHEIYSLAGVPMALMDVE